MTAPWETITVPCQQCRMNFKTPAGRRRRAIRLGRPISDFCSAKCCKLYIAAHGKYAQDNPPKKKEE